MIKQKYFFSSWLYRYRLTIVLTWLILIIFCLFELNYYPKEQMITESTGASYSEAYQVMEILRDDFEFRLGTTLALVLKGDELSENMRQELLNHCQRIKHITAFKIKKNSNIKLYFFQFEKNVQLIDGSEIVKEIREVTQKWEDQTGVKTYLTGNLAFYSDILAESKTYISSAEFVALSCAFLILLFSFGGLWASLLPIIMGVSTLVLDRKSVV